MILIQIHLICLDCARPSIAVQCRILVLNAIHFIAFIFPGGYLLPVIGIGKLQMQFHVQSLAYVASITRYVALLFVTH